MPSGQPAGRRRYERHKRLRAIGSVGFVLVDLGGITAHNPQLRLVLTLPGRQFRTFGWQSLERHLEPNSAWFRGVPHARRRG
jgi:hypothetical protein